MFKNPSLKKIIKLIQLARLRNKKDLSLQTVLEIKNDSEKSRLFNRREMLKITGQAAALLPFSGLVAHHAIAQSIRKPLKSDAPIIIVGGGIAGLVAAYRLSNAGIACELYEAGDRLGGRMFTHENFNSDGMFCELGGELVDNDHTDLIQLCNELGVGIQSINDEDHSIHTDLFYVDGRVISEREMLEAFQPLAAHINSDIEAAFGGSTVKTPTYKDKNDPSLVKYDQMPLSEYLYSKTDVDKWVLDLINVLYVCEFGLELDQQSTLNFLTLITIDTIGSSDTNPKLLGDSDESNRIAGGSSTLPNAIVRAIQDRVPIHLGYQLVKIQERGRKLKLTFIKESSVTEITAAQIVCAIPFSTLRHVEGIYNIGLNSNMQECIRSLGYGTNSKFMLGFKSRVWRNQGKESSNGGLLTITQQQFWETSRMQPGKCGILTQFLGGDFGRQLPRDNLISTLRLLEKVYPGAQDQFDGYKKLHHWPSHLWSKGSYSCFKPGQYTTMQGLAAERHLSDRLLFAGEHTSIESGGFMNGAVESGNRVSETILKLRSLTDSHTSRAQKTIMDHISFGVLH